MKSFQQSLAIATLALFLIGCPGSPSRPVAKEKGKETGEKAKEINEKIGDPREKIKEAKGWLDKGLGFKNKFGFQASPTNCELLAEFDVGFREGSDGKSYAESAREMADQVEDSDSETAESLRDLADDFERAESDCDEPDKSMRPQPEDGPTDPLLV